jgi:hypothetical protein
VIREILAIGLAVNLALVGLVDVWLITVHGPQASITALVHEVSQRWPAIPLVVGLIMGHLFL